MARVKFLFFALAVLGLWAAHLYLLTPAVTARAVELAQERTALAPHVVGLEVSARKLQIQRMALEVAGTGPALALLQPGRAGKVEAPTPEKLADFRALLSQALPEDLRADVVLAVMNEAGAVAARGETALEDGTVDLAALGQAGAEGVNAELGEVTYQFHAVPVLAADKPVATVVVGAPLVSAQMLERALAQTGMGALGLLKDGKVVHAAGAQAQVVEKDGANVRVGKPDILSRGALSNLGPLQLPFLVTGTDYMGGEAPLWLGVRQPLPGTAFEVVAVASSGALLGAIADYQRVAVFAFGGLFGLTLVFLLIMGSGKRALKAAGTEKAEQTSAPQKAEATSHAPAQAEAAPGALPELPPAPDAIPDDFPFGGPPSPRPQQEVAAAPEPQAAPEPAPAQHPPAPEPAPSHGGNGLGHALFDDAPPPTGSASFSPEATQAYPANADPFALAAAQGSAFDQMGPGDDNPEATRVAAVPAELLQQAARAADAPAAVRVRTFSPPPPAVSAPSAPQDPEEAHYLEVFQSFVQTREQCGEAADGLTFDKFAVKLRKNREQLVAKYQCRTVRFQVYVKEGKAALKATPVKE